MPAVDWDFTTRRVLATEWIDGISLKDREALLAPATTRSASRRVIQTFLKHALRDGFFHADMHPGNLFVDAAGRLVAVDFGIMGRLDPMERRFMAETLGRLPRARLSPRRRNAFSGRLRSAAPLRRRLRASAARHRRADLRPARDNMSMARLLTQLFEVTRLFDMEMQPQLVMLQKTMVVVEGVARQARSRAFDCGRPPRARRRAMDERSGPQARIKEAAVKLGGIGR